MDEKERYWELHKEAIVIDATCPLGAVDHYYKRWIEGGVTVMIPTIAANHSCRETIGRIAAWHRTIETHSDELLLVTSVDDIYRAKKERKLGVIFHFQDSLPIEGDLNLLTIYRQLGVRIIQLCYNVRNFIGDGCDERTDSGLSQFGVSAVKEMNRLGIVIDLSHTGYQTTMEVMKISEKPVIFSHSNVYQLCPSPRNIKDDQIKAVAEKDGVIGIVGFPAFVSKSDTPTVDNYVDHIDYIAKLVGVRHVGIGIDYYEGMDGIASMEEATKIYDQLITSGKWKAESYPPPPWKYPSGIEDPSKFPNLTKALLKRGYSEEHVLQILGGNFIRVYEEVWAK
ncbi:dipeptidase [Ammoniphilus sp. YIM 78166]|uniref:dipeptidase n=1 Tax=Ammoniphilus sp. YIM 78166 TaxID=1644106 RepID=UPI0010705574|nr:dipeptidase [Ammoniphilus sp. YIM 78166]